MGQHRIARLVVGAVALGLPIAGLAAPANAAPSSSVAPNVIIAATAPAQAVARAPKRNARKKRTRIVMFTMSARSDMVSGGDVRVAVKPVKGVRYKKMRFFLNGRNVSGRFAFRSNTRFEAYLKGLKVGKNVLKARTPNKRRGRLKITNHPNGGPIFSGPQFPIYECQDSATDAACNEKPKFSLLYKSTNPAESDLKPYDPKDPPNDVATTRGNGKTVPFIVLREDGYQDRDRYSILTLFQPGKRWSRFKPQPQYNGRILVTHGGNCGASYTPGEPRLQDYSGTIPEGTPGVTPSYVTALSRGMGVIAAALNNTGHNCNVAMNAESVMMAKERFVEQYGTIRYTIGTGCSGGSIAQHTVANAYPGIYQGLLTSCSYPDVITAGAQFADYNLMRQYFEQPDRWAPGVVWDPVTIARVEGHVTPVNAVVADEGLYKTALNPEADCPGTKTPVADDPSTRYDRETNPAGVRCSVLDLLIKNLGPRPREVWTEPELAAGRGFGGIPLANEGLLYGLEVLKDGGITTQQFVDLNVKIGGLDVDSVRTDERFSGDPQAIARAYRTSLINATNNMDDVAIINSGGPDPGIAHDYAHAFWTEGRMRREHGGTPNRVMWFGETPLIGNVNWANESLVLMDKWLKRVGRDRTDRSLTAKIAANRPGDVTDRCSSAARIVKTTNPSGETNCILPDALQLRLSTPREVAGDDVLNDRVACQLKPLRRSEFDFLLLPMTDDQFEALQNVYPNGICDFSKPGQGQQKGLTWLVYANADGSVRFGGRKTAPPRPFSGTGLSGSAWKDMIFK